MYVGIPLIWKTIIYGLFGLVQHLSDNRLLIHVDVPVGRHLYFKRRLAPLLHLLYLLLRVALRVQIADVGIHLVLNAILVRQLILNLIH